MKRRLNTLKGKKLVTGDFNLMTKDEICINTISDGMVEVKEIGNDGKIKDLTSGSSDAIYIGIKKPFLESEKGYFSDILKMMWGLGLYTKYTNACYYCWGNEYGYEDAYIREYVIAINVPVIPEIPNQVSGILSYSTFEQLKLSFLEQGFTEQEFDSNFYEMTREEFFTPSPEIIDKLTLEVDNHKLIVDFAKNTYEKDGVVSKITDSYVPKFTDLTTASNGETVCNNVKYETNTDNYVEYYERFSSDVYYLGRIKVNGVGPDPNYGNIRSADGYRHSSGIIVGVIE